MTKAKKIPCNDGLLCWILLDIQDLSKAVRKITNKKLKEDLKERVDELLENFEDMVGPKFVKEVKKLPDTVDLDSMGL